MRLPGGTLLYLTAIAAFGVLVPWIRGLGLLDPLSLVLYACLAWVFSAPPAIQIVDSHPCPNRGDLLARISRAVTFGWGTSIVILALGIAVINRQNWHEEVVVPETPLLASALGVGLTGAWLAATGGVYLRLRGWSAKSVRLVLRMFLVMALLGYALANRIMPDFLALQMTSDVFPSRLAVLAICLAAAEIFLLRASLALCSRTEPAPAPPA